MRFVSAVDLLPEAPEGLQALRFLDRQPAGPIRRLYAVGDVGFCGHLSAADGMDPWIEVGPLLRGGDVVFANLETPLVAPCDEVWLFSGPTSSAQRLAAGGFRIVNLANNHIADTGPAGIVSTLESLDAVGLTTVGAGADATSARRMVVTDLEDMKIGWLACARTLQKQADGPAFWEFDAEELLAAVRRHRDEVEVLVVSIHCGYMFVDYPHPDHRQLALDLAAAGADLVVAHHAHVLQGIEVTAEGACLCHNLGNFLFDWTVGEVPVDSFVEEQRCGAVLVAEVDRHGICRLAALPTRVDDQWIVRWAMGETGRAVLERLARISRDLGSDYSAEFGRQRAERNTGLALRSMAHSLLRGKLWPVIEVLPRLRPHHLAMVFRWLGRKPER